MGKLLFNLKAYKHKYSVKAQYHNFMASFNASKKTQVTPESVLMFPLQTEESSNILDKSERL
jgi:hypothetical protein